MKWQTLCPRNAPWHVYPLNDLKEHVTDGPEQCWCQPLETDGVIVHNSMDGREAFETGERKPS
jgi:hypothetical protein